MKSSISLKLVQRLGKEIKNGNIVNSILWVNEFKETNPVVVSAIKAKALQTAPELKNNKTFEKILAGATAEQLSEEELQEVCTEPAKEGAANQKVTPGLLDSRLALKKANKGIATNYSSSYQPHAKLRPAYKAITRRLSLAR